MSMRRQLPPLNALKAFEAAGRYASIKSAADELAVTPAAISQQIKILEAWLGEDLFHRQPRGVTLTAAGQALWPDLRLWFDQLNDRLERARAGQPRRAFTIAVFPSLAVLWLMPRLDRLQQVLGAIEPRVVTLRDSADIDPDDIDVALHYQMTHPDLVSTEIAAREAFAVISPRRLTAGPPITHPADLLNHPLLHEEPMIIDGVVDSDIDWPGWLGHFGVADPRAARGPVFGYHHLCLQAAVDGAGAALTTMLLAGDLLTAGALVRPLPHQVPKLDPCYLAWPRRLAADPLVASVTAWFRQEMAMRPGRSDP